MNLQKTEQEGVLLVTPPTIFEDFRGDYIELYNEELYNQAGIDVKFVQDDISVSSRHVLRGLHGDQSTWKLISCLIGRIYLVTADNRSSSSTYRKWQSFILSEQNHLQILVPPGVALGHLVLSEKAIFHYKQSTYYNRSSQFTLLWNDPSFDIWWPVKEPILSRRDQGL